LENLVERLSALDVSLIVLEATGGFETTVAAAQHSTARRYSATCLRAPAGGQDAEEPKLGIVARNV
jgi:hypothetical protein